MTGVLTTTNDVGGVDGQVGKVSDRGSGEDQAGILGASAAGPTGEGFASCDYF